MTNSRRRLFAWRMFSFDWREKSLLRERSAQPYWVRAGPCKNPPTFRTAESPASPLSVFLFFLFLYSPLLSTTLAAIFLYLQSPVSKIQKKNPVPPRSQTRYLSSSYSVHVNTSTRLKPSICIITPQDLWVGSGLLSGGFALAFILIFLFYFFPASAASHLLDDWLFEYASLSSACRRPLVQILLLFFFLHFPQILFFLLFLELFFISFPLCPLLTTHTPFPWENNPLVIPQNPLAISHYHFVHHGHRSSRKARQ